jgi:hypothetical protein
MCGRASWGRRDSGFATHCRPKRARLRHEAAHLPVSGSEAQGCVGADSVRTGRGISARG